MYSWLAQGILIMPFVSSSKLCMSLLILLDILTQFAFYLQIFTQLIEIFMSIIHCRLELFLHKVIRIDLTLLNESKSHNSIASKTNMKKIKIIFLKNFSFTFSRALGG